MANKNYFKLSFVVLLMLFTGTVMAQNTAIKGVVTDAVTSETMIGVSVVEKGTTNGTMTNLDGSYTLTVKGSNAILVFSFIGYKPLEKTVGTQTEINVALDEDIHMLDEVIAIGYGSSRKQDLSTAVSSIKIDSSMKGQTSDFSTIMQGRLPGVTIQSSGGDPMNSSVMSIRGRGSRGEDNSSSGGDGVLYVVDGVPNVPFNMADVETVTVLKDAASAAIYGASVGSGGVIVITTKGAQAGKAKVSLNIYQGIQNASNLPKTLTSEQYNSVWDRAIKDKKVNSASTLPTVADPSKYPYGMVTRTDWVDEIFRTAYQQHYDLSITGGTEVLKSMFSASYDRNEGILKNTYKETLNAKLNLEFQLTKWMKFSERVTFQYTNGQGGLNNRNHEGIIMNAVFYPRSASVHEYDQNGNQLYDASGKSLYGGTVPAWAAASGIAGYGNLRNPVAALERLRQNRPTSKLYSTSGLEIKPISGLTVKSDFTISLASDRYEYFSSKALEIGLPNKENERFISSTWNTNWLWETTANYAVQLGDKHSLSALGGYSMNYDNYRYTATSVFDFPREDEHYGIFPSGRNYGKSQPQERIEEESMISAFARLGYSYDDRYFATASIRNDASSKLPKGKRNGQFPAFSASWKISSESFFEPLKDKINLLKIRGSWGQVGNVKVVPKYIAPMVFGPYPAIYGKELDKQIYGTYQQTYYNSNLTWERTEQTGLGLDMALLNNSLNITVDYFKKNTKDLIERIPTPSVGQRDKDPYGNIGEVENSGWEFSASYNKTIDKVAFNVWGNLSTVKNEVKNLGGRDFIAHNDNAVTLNGISPLHSAVGQAWYSYYLIKSDGIFQSQAEVDNYIDAKGNKIQPQAVAGDIKFIDANGDGVIDAKDKQYLGSFLPKITYSFGAGINYNDFDFNFMFQGVAKVKIYNGYRQMGLYGRDSQHNMLAEVMESWNFDKSSGLPRLSIAGDDNGNFTQASDYFLESGAYLRLKNVTIGYTLPKKTMSAIGLSSSNIRFYLSGENLATITPYKGIDPEVGNLGMDGGNYPIPRSFKLGVNINF